MTAATANDPRRRSWIDVAAGSDFPIQNLPLGVADMPGGRHIVSRIGDVVVDLQRASELSFFDGIPHAETLLQPTLNALFAAGRPAITAVRERLAELLCDASLTEPIPSGEQTVCRTEQSAAHCHPERSAAHCHPERSAGGAQSKDAQSKRERLKEALFPIDQARMVLPVDIGDYVDFYSSLEHATNLGRLFRPDAEPLLPNWRWLPVGYHGRSGTIVADGTPIVRPNGQRKAPSDAVPFFGPSRQLDIELEMGFFAAAGNELGKPIAAADALQHVAGLVLVNDWSARDIQAWEYQPLGPFLGKSFATTISPWVVTLDALEPFTVAPAAQNPPPLPYLQDAGFSYDVQLSVELQTAAMRDTGIAPVQIARATFAGMYWTIAQQLAHATVNGAVARPGDLFASGTISGTDPGSYGSFIELTWRGTRPLKLPSGETRAFLEDGDEVILRGWCERAGARRIGFGCARGRIAAANA